MNVQTERFERIFIGIVAILAAGDLAAVAISGPLVLKLIQYRSSSSGL